MEDSCRMEDSFPTDTPYAMDTSYSTDPSYTMDTSYITDQSGTMNNNSYITDQSAAMNNSFTVEVDDFSITDNAYTTDPSCNMYTFPPKRHSYPTLENHYRAEHPYVTRLAGYTLPACAVSSPSVSSLSSEDAPDAPAAPVSPILPAAQAPPSIRTDHARGPIRHCSRPASQCSWETASSNHSKSKAAKAARAVRRAKRDMADRWLSFKFLLRERVAAMRGIQTKDALNRPHASDFPWLAKTAEAQHRRREEEEEKANKRRPSPMVSSMYLALPKPSRRYPVPVPTPELVEVSAARAVRVADRIPEMPTTRAPAAAAAPAEDESSLEDVLAASGPYRYIPRAACVDELEAQMRAGRGLPVLDYGHGRLVMTATNYRMPRQRANYSRPAPLLPEEYHRINSQYPMARPKFFRLRFWPFRRLPDPGRHRNSDDFPEITEVPILSHSYR